MSYKCICNSGATIGHISGCDNQSGCRACCKGKGGINEDRSGDIRIALPENPTNTLNADYTKNYSVLGGVVAPKRSAYTLMGMRNPNLEQPKKALDTSLPSLRQEGAVANFNNFNPYGNAPKRSSEVVRNTMSMRRKHSPILTTVINTFEGGHTPILPKKYIKQY